MIHLFLNLKDTARVVHPLELTFAENGVAEWVLRDGAIQIDQLIL